MSTYQEQLDDTVVLLSASGIGGTPAERKAWAEEVMNDPAAWARLNVDILRSYGANLDAAA